ncbi:hypothetical protein FLLO111716_06355 [Flavobacterium longum]|uniref:hypothetical protein n=1 Tax=Flavobacterium longum TaxID=1299340 RepID=UPI0039EAF683
MKSWITVALLLMTGTVAAQYHNGETRRLTGATMQQSKKKSPDKEELVDMSVRLLTEELSLDGFQAAVIEQLLSENQKAEEKIVVQDIPKESKIEQIIALREKMNAKIKGVLQPEQVEKFEKMSKKKKK